MKPAGDLDLARRSQRRRSLERGLEHIYSELEGSVEAIWETITPQEQLQWSDVLPWASQLLQPDGSMKLEVFRGLDEIRGFYERIYSYRPPTDFVVNTLVAGEWWMFVEAPVEYEHPVTRATSGNVTAALVFTDGWQGISGEIAWRRGERPAGGPDEGQVTELHNHLLKVLQQADIDAITAMFDADVEAAVLAHFGYSEPFVQIGNRHELHDYYDRFYSAAQVIDVRAETLITRPWFAMSELEWTVEVRSAPGSRATFETCEILGVGLDGKFVSRVGFGTRLVREPA
jgi:hypothetical protein